MAHTGSCDSAKTQPPRPCSTAGCAAVLGPGVFRGVEGLGVKRGLSWLNPARTFMGWWARCSPWKPMMSRPLSTLRRGEVVATSSWEPSGAHSASTPFSALHADRIKQGRARFLRPRAVCMVAAALLPTPDCGQGLNRKHLNPHPQTLNPSTHPELWEPQALHPEGDSLLLLPRHGSTSRGAGQNETRHHK